MSIHILVPSMTAWRLITCRTRRTREKVINLLEPGITVGHLSPRRLRFPAICRDLNMSPAGTPERQS